jgi:hypothetical protein
MKSANDFLKSQIRRVLYSARPEVCMDVARWALERKLTVMEIYPPVLDEVQPHIRDDTYALDAFAHHRQALERPQILVTIENASIRDAVGFVELPDGQICYEGNWWLPNLHKHPAYQKCFFLKQRHLKGNWYSFLSMWAPEYYHWFHDALPRLENALPHLPSDIRFLINENPRNYQLESLKAYGITADQLEVQPSGVRTKVEHLWFASPVGSENLGSGEIASRVARRLKKHFLPVKQSSRPRKIYISRKKAVSRRVVNESECQPVLEDLGFDMMVLEDIPWHEQVTLFSFAEAIMGAHGAGLTNMMFSPNSAAILEIVPRVCVGPHFLILARQLGHQFQRLHAEPVGDESKGDMRLQLSQVMALKNNSDIS